MESFIGIYCFCYNFYIGLVPVKVGILPVTFVKDQDWEYLVHFKV